MKSIYIGCALKEAPAEFVAEVETFKDSLRNIFAVKDFVGFDPETSAATIYTTDIAHAASADIMLAICDQPSTGLGMEIQKRIELKKETYIAYHADKEISRMVLGAAENLECFHLIAYQKLDDIIKHIT